MEAFYLPDPSDPTRFESTELTRGPWAADAQHAGPPSALLGHLVERCEPREGFRVARIAVEILGPVPLAPVVVEARVTRPGRSVELVEATMSSTHGPVLKANAWRIRQAEPELDLPEALLASATRPGPDTVAEASDFPTAHEIGFHTGIEYRFSSGGFTEPGPAVCWMRLRRPVVAGTAPSPLERTLVAADHGNGISTVLDWETYLFINTDLTVTLHREPVGEWICLDAATYPERNGIGLAESRLFDEKGPVGRGTQTLFIGRRK